MPDNAIKDLHQVGSDTVIAAQNWRTHLERLFWKRLGWVIFAASVGAACYALGAGIV